MWDVRRLRLLVELRDRGTLAAVAEALAYSPSSVSQQLAQLEKEVGVELLAPAGRRVQLTPAAELLVVHARRVLDELEDAQAALAGVGGSVGGTVRIAAFQSAAHAIVPQALALLAREHPSLRVEMRERPPEAGLFEVTTRDADLVLAEQYPGRTRPLLEGLDRQPLASDTMRLAVPPHPAGREVSPRTLATAAGRAWVLEPEGTASREWAEQLCRSAGFEPDVRFETADLMAHIRLIRSGAAVGLLPDLVWAGEAPSVLLHDLPGAPQREVFSATRGPAAARPAVLAVRDALRRAAERTATPV
ncbi:LysR substrate-binding domain-containing protein [Agromyces seonyuensis]|uniref:LysR family transcriptional regulator n=1 Tax=Agromyces seonyuensis TaxID=2662446 RepID=A0A6I4NXS8_9MICO|nr:LysR substrate-binding domain-containing protein [Agromyces seonyuensis]MWB97942.1 LysR family transcriptional regulator [Agromyces seonyuensis]